MKVWKLRELLNSASDFADVEIEAGDATFKGIEQVDVNGRGKVVLWATEENEEEE